MDFNPIEFYNSSLILFDGLNKIKLSSLGLFNMFFLEKNILLNFFFNICSTKGDYEQIKVSLILRNNFIFFSYLEGFDNVTATILLNDKTQNILMQVNYQNYKDFDVKILANID